MAHTSPTVLSRVPTRHRTCRCRLPEARLGRSASAYCKGGSRTTGESSRSTVDVPVTTHPCDRRGWIGTEAVLLHASAVLGWPGGHLSRWPLARGHFPAIRVGCPRRALAIRLVNGEWATVLKKAGGLGAERHVWVVARRKAALSSARTRRLSRPLTRNGLIRRAARRLESRSSCSTCTTRGGGGDPHLSARRSSAMPSSSVRSRQPAASGC